MPERMHAAPSEGAEVIDREGTFPRYPVRLLVYSPKCATADEAVKMLTETEWIHTGNINISDNNGNVYVVGAKRHCLCSP